MTPGDGRSEHPAPLPAATPRPHPARVPEAAPPPEAAPAPEAARPPQEAARRAEPPPGTAELQAAAPRAELPGQERLPARATDAAGHVPSARERSPGETDADRRRALHEDIALLVLALLIVIVPGLLRAPRSGDIRESGEPVRPARIRVNAAPWYEWMLLPGIGESRARAIVAARETRGGFRSIDDLKLVPGLPADVVEKARPHLSLEE